MHRNFFFLGFLLLLAHWAGACQTPAQPPLSGKITLSEGWKPVVYLVEPRSFGEIAANFSGRIVDSATIAPDGAFAFPNIQLAATPRFFQLEIQTSGERYANKIVDKDPVLANYLPVILKNGEPVALTAQAGNLQASAHFERSSYDNAVLSSLIKTRNAAYNEQRALLGNPEHPDENNLLAVEDALALFRAPMMAFADTTNSVWAALLATRWVSPEGDFERVPEFIARQCGRWSEKNAGNILVAGLCEKADKQHLPVLQGDLIPDFALPMSNGDTVTLHSLLGARLTILDIWASWCMPCRRENRDVLLPIWTEFHSKGVQIVGYSIDSGAQAWRAAIAKDQAAWPHASHLTGDATPFMDALRISTIPANFVLDKEGRVVAKNLHGAALKAFVEGYK